MKRLFDIFLTSCMVVVLSVPLVMIWTAVRLSSRGPALYWSDRVGKANHLFKMPKFRSMRVGAPAVATHLFKCADSYLTPIGSFLRKSSLDELPQLWNIINGDMSLVGPRPERPEFTEELELKIPFYRARFSVRPGVTGWAQIKYKYTNTMDDTNTKLEYDMYYIKNRSIYYYKSLTIWI